MYCIFFPKLLVYLFVCLKYLKDKTKNIFLLSFTFEKTYSIILLKLRQMKRSIKIKSIHY